MKIAVSSMGKGLDDNVDPRFGRCQFFVIMDSETQDVTVIDNQAGSSMGGAGIKAAQTVADHDVEAVITGNVGPNAFDTLNAAGIRIFVGASGTVREVLELFDNNKLKEAEGSSVGSHFGMGNGTGRGRGGIDKEGN